MELGEEKLAFASGPRLVPFTLGPDAVQRLGDRQGPELGEAGVTDAELAEVVSGPGPGHHLLPSAAAAWAHAGAGTRTWPDSVRRSESSWASMTASSPGSSERRRTRMK